MKTPSESKNQPIDKKSKKRNLLLTPFLLSLPVIFIVFALISGLHSGAETEINKPLQHETFSYSLERNKSNNSDNAPGVKDTTTSVSNTSSIRSAETEEPNLLP